MLCCASLGMRSMFCDCIFYRTIRAGQVPPILLAGFVV
jgi:hypothetical protein